MSARRGERRNERRILLQSMWRLHEDWLPALFQCRIRKGTGTQSSSSRPHTMALIRLRREHSVPGERVDISSPTILAPVRPGVRGDRASAARERIGGPVAVADVVRVHRTRLSFRIGLGSVLPSSAAEGF